jgi:hypothetical protein
VASLTQRISQAARSALLGISTYALPDQPAYLYDIDSPNVQQMREMLGGQLVPATVSKVRWYMADLESAERSADTGDLTGPGMLMLAARKDGHLSGVLSTRTDGLVRLPKRFRGDAEVVAELEAGHESVRSTFDDMFPPNCCPSRAARFPYWCGSIRNIYSTYGLKTVSITARPWAGCPCFRAMAVGSYTCPAAA